jgi:hypothetical protein
VQVPRTFDALLHRALAKRPDERYQSAAEFKQAILTANSSAAAGTRLDIDLNQGQTTLVNAPGTASPHPGRSRALRLGLPLAAVCLAGVGAAAYFWLVPHSAGTTSVASRSTVSAGAAATGLATNPGANSAVLPADAVRPQTGTAVVSAVGLADPEDPRWANETAAVERLVWGDARRQLIAKAVALYVDPSSINANYAVLRNKLLARSDEYISTVLEQLPPQISKYGLMIGTMRATVKIRDVQKALNQISRDDRIEFIRNNGDPRIAVSIRTQSAQNGAEAAMQRSQVAENLLKERIRSFGFVIMDDQLAKPAADFLVDGEVRFKRLSATLAASGLTIEKVVLTSWTVRAVDATTGEEIYHNTTIPEKKSWATEEIALQDVGRLIGAEFSRKFFLQYFDFGAEKVRLRFTGLPPAASSAVLPEINATLRVLNAGPVKQDGADVVIDTDLSGGGSVSTADLVQESLLGSLNRKLGKKCFTVAGASVAEVHVMFDEACTPAATLDRLDTLPPEALIDSPALRIEDVVKDPNLLHRVKI